MRHCLVVGASGFVGRVLCDRLRKDGVRVRALLRSHGHGTWDEAVSGDLLETSKFDATVFSGVDTVVYLASIAHRHASEAEYQRLNVDACLAFAHKALDNGISRFIYISSSKAALEDCSTTMSELDNDWPRDLYGLSKRRAEEGLLALQGFTHLVILRPCLVYGAGVKGNLLSMMNAIQRGYFPSLPDLPSRRSMVSVRDVVSAVFLVAHNPKAHRQVYLLSDGQDYSIKQIENAMRQSLGKKYSFWSVPISVLMLAGRVGNLLSLIPGYKGFTSEFAHKLLDSALYSSEKIRQQIGWISRETFYSVLPEMTDHFLANQNSANRGDA